MKRASLAALALMLLAGCGGADPAGPDPAGPADRTSSEAPGDREGVFDPLTDTIDRAESVQDTVDAQAEALRRQIEEAEGN